MWLQPPPLGTPLNFEDPLNTGLVMHLAMNEGHGDVVRDLSLYGNHGTLHNFAFPPTVASGWNPGAKGIGMTFDGTDDYIDFEPSWIDLSSSAATISMRIKAAFNSLSIMLIDGKSHLGLGFYTDAIFGQALIVVSETVHSQPIQFIPDWNDNIWNDIVITYDVNHNPTGYMNGVLLLSGDDNYWTESSNDFFIGKRTTGDFINASIDEVRILNRACTPKEVVQRTIDPWGVYLQDMTTVEKLRLVHSLCVNLIDETSMNDPRMAAIMSVRDGIVNVVEDLEFGEQPKSL
jgi:hypothetical protein